MDKDKRLMEVCWWERLTEREIEYFSDGQGHAEFSSVQSLSSVWLFATPWIAARQSSLSLTNTRSSLRLTSIQSVMTSSHLILWHPLLFLPQSLLASVFSNESTLRMRWPKYWSFSFSIISSKEMPGLIYFRMDCLDLLEVQGTLKSLLQHHSSKASILRCSSFFTVQLSYPYMTTDLVPSIMSDTVLNAGNIAVNTEDILMDGARK